jgi:hypothetical protein
MVLVPIRITLRTYVLIGVAVGLRNRDSDGFLVAVVGVALAVAA